jgi:hypothetical protein
VHTSSDILSNQIAVMRCFFAQVVAVALSTQVALLQDVILETYATVFNIALMRYLKLICLVAHGP